MNLPVWFGFSSPWWLLLLGLLPLVWRLSRRSLAGLSGPRRSFAIAIRLIVLLLLICSLAEMRLLKRNDRLAVFFVVDRSESIPAELREASREYILEQAEGRSSTHADLVGVVAFGKTAGIESSPKPDPLELESFVTVIEPDATNLAAAVRLAAAAFPDGCSRRIVILSDGNENRESILEEARLVSSRGITIDVVPIRYSYPAEIAVDKLVVDPQVNVGQPFTVRTVVEATRATEIYLRLFENRILVTESGARVQLKPGKNVFDFQRRFDLAGKFDFEVRIEPVKPGDDSVLLNNTAAGFTYIQGEPKVLLCAVEADLDRALVEALNSERIAVTVTAPEFLPRAIEEYFDYQAIIFSNVPAHALSEELQLIMETLVKTVGIGFIMIGGENSFGAGGYQGTPVERLLPVDMEIKQRKVLPNGALAMVIHSCELGNGNQWAIQVVQQAIKILSPRDHAGVLYYDSNGQDRWLFPMTPVAQRQMMLSRLKGFNPGDMPSFQGIVQMAYNGLVQTSASIKHLIVLSDGDPTLPGPAILQAIQAARITISTICYGAHGDYTQGMRQLAQQTGGKFYNLTSPRNLPEIFLREATTVQKSLISEEAFRPILATRGAFLQGIGAEALPRLDGYVITSPKDLATMNLLHPPGEQDPIQDPVLASWSYGLGKSIAFTSDAGRRWGKAWVSWEGYQRFWSQCVRWVSRPQNDDRFRVSRAVDGDRARITIDAITPDGHFLNGLKLRGMVAAPDHTETLDVEVRQVSPGRYAAEFPLGGRGNYTVALGYEKEGVTQTIVTAVSLPYSAEYRKLSTNEELLRQVAVAAGGRYFDDPVGADFFSRDFAITREVQPVWHRLVLLALVLFFLDVFVRRVVVDYRTVMLESVRKTWALIRRRGGTPVATDARLATLLERKAEVREATQVRYQATTARDTAAASSSSLSDVAALLAQKAAEPAVKPPPPAPKPTAETGYTSRLLEAKRRAQKQDNQGKSSPPQKE